MENTWAQWFRSVFDKILCFVAWGREAAGTLMGAFLGLVTGSRIAVNNAVITTNSNNQEAVK